VTQCGLDSLGSRWGQVADSYDYYNESSGSVKGGGRNFLTSWAQEDCRLSHGAAEQVIWSHISVFVGPGFKSRLEHMLSWLDSFRPGVSLVAPGKFQGCNHFLPHFFLFIVCFFCYGTIALVGLGRFFTPLIYTQSVGLLGWGSARRKATTYTENTQTPNKRTQTSIPLVGFEPTIPASERAKTEYALDYTATVIGSLFTNHPIVWPLHGDSVQWSFTRDQTCQYGVIIRRFRDYFRISHQRLPTSSRVSMISPTDDAESIRNVGHLTQLIAREEFLILFSLSYWQRR
jgi:hypothetical protein